MPEVPTKALLQIGIVLAASTLALVVLGTFGSSVQLEGSLQPEGGQIEVLAPIGGTVVQVNAAEGADIPRGTIVATLKAQTIAKPGVDSSEDVGAQLKAKASRIQAQLRDQNALIAAAQRNAAGRLALAQAKLGYIENQLKLQHRREELSLENLKAFTDLESQGFVSALGILPHREKVLDASAGLAALERELAAQRLEESTLRQALRDEEQRLTDVAIELQRQYEDASLEFTRHFSQSTRHVTTTSDARVLRVLAHEGHSVTSGDLIALLSASNDRQVARFQVGSEYIAELAIGQAASIEAAGYAREKHGTVRGTVRHISRSGAPSDRLKDSVAPPGSARQALFTVDMTIDEGEFARKQIPLRSGMRLTARLQLAERPLYAWLLAPFNEGGSYAPNR